MARHQQGDQFIAHIFIAERFAGFVAGLQQHRQHIKPIAQGLGPALGNHGVEQRVGLGSQLADAMAWTERPEILLQPREKQHRRGQGCRRHRQAAGQQRFQFAVALSLPQAKHHLQNHPHADALHRLPHRNHPLLGPAGHFLARDPLNHTRIILQVLAMETGHHQLAAVTVGSTAQQNRIAHTKQGRKDQIEFARRAEFTAGIATHQRLNRLGFSQQKHRAAAHGVSKDRHLKTVLALAHLVPQEAGGIQNPAGQLPATP